MAQKVGILHDPESLKGLAEQLRDEANRAEARAELLSSGKMKPTCESGCFNILSTCMYIQPI